MHLTRYLPSYLTIAGYRILISYEGQPPTCYSCGEVGHLYHACSARRANEYGRKETFASTYASVVTHTATSTGRHKQDMNTSMEQNNTHDNNGDNTQIVRAPIVDTDTNAMEQETSMTWK
jgi:hypothetical protein